MKGNKSVARNFRRWRYLVVLFVIVIWGAHSAYSSNQGDKPKFHRFSENAGQGGVSTPSHIEKGDTDLSVGNNRVRFYFSRSGEWRGIFPSWEEGRSLFSSGGFLVLASGPEGGISVIASTAPARTAETRTAGNILTREDKGGFAQCCEGIKGGNRCPALDPDDDADGRLDEDRLDGIDNDGDGFVDEDFAAIGDEMVVTEYHTAAASEAAAMSFHQESYTWALPHIEGMVAIRLCVENNGEKPIENIRIGAFFEKEGPFTLSEDVLTTRPNLQADTEQARALLSSTPDGAVMGLLLLAVNRNAGSKADWDLWVSGPGGPAETGFEKIIKNRTMEHVSGESGYRTDNPPAAEQLGTRHFAAGEKAFAGGVSPILGNLPPGEAVDITVALIVVQKREALERALVDAHRTYLGDGTNRFIPPPVPVTPFMVWGTYRTAGFMEDGLFITIEKNPAENFCPTRITFLSGVDLDDVEIASESSDGVELHIRGVSAERLLKRSGERIVLKGKDATGAFFDAILNPLDNTETGQAGIAEDAERYWETPGKLSEDLLSGSPNPFREQTTLFYEVPSVLKMEDGSEAHFEGMIETNLKVYDVTGRLVSILVDEMGGPGFYRTDWRAVDENGSPVASGVYYIKLQIGKRYITKRLILLR